MGEADSQFTDRASKIWSSIPYDLQKAILTNVWCSKCSDMTTIVDFNGTVERKDLILRGYCKKCGGEVARLLENDD